MTDKEMILYEIAAQKQYFRQHHKNVSSIRSNIQGKLERHEISVIPGGYDTHKGFVRLVNENDEIEDFKGPYFNGSINMILKSGE